jgi:hypothetical protein
MKYYASEFALDPNIPTEETMFHRLLESNVLSDEYTLCALPLTHMINTLGVPGTQAEIDKVHVEGKKLFVCQHILTERLKFDKDSIVATPHATIGSGYISIPHFPVCVDKSKMKEERSMLFSFMGSIQTHEIRRGLTILYPKNCFDSGHLWGLDPSIPNKQAHRERYTEMLGDSEFSMCPRGTGISSVRLFESMAMGAIPIIIADGYKPPLHTKVDWSQISISVPSNRISKIGQSLTQSFTKDKIRAMRTRMTEAYEEYFSPERFERSIELML